MAVNNNSGSGYLVYGLSPSYNQTQLTELENKNDLNEESKSIQGEGASYKLDMSKLVVVDPQEYNSMREQLGMAGKVAYTILAMLGLILIAVKSQYLVGLCALSSGASGVYLSAREHALQHLRKMINPGDIKELSWEDAAICLPLLIERQILAKVDSATSKVSNFFNQFLTQTAVDKAEEA